MTTTATTITRAADEEAIAPLVDMCKKGRLFEVQSWISSGKPVNPPPPPTKGRRPKTPLEIEIDRGFHSLVQVLLDNGAIQEPEGYDAPIYQALRARRFDIVQQLVEHGFDPKTIDMHEVFRTWDPKIMDYFIERGADIQQDHPFAVALCERIRMALGPYKRCREQMPKLQKQADIALRHHCKAGNMKWVSLMLWAGANPFALGTDDPSEELDEDDEPLSALGFAALYEHYEVFELKPIRSKLPGPHATEILPYLLDGKGLEILKKLLEKGLNPNNPVTGGCSAIGSCLDRMSWHQYYETYSWKRNKNKQRLDTNRSRECLKAIHLLARHSAKWVPTDKREIDLARRSLLRLVPDYTVEFVWIMSKYKACELDSIQELLRTPTIKSHTAPHRSRLLEILESW